MSARRRSSGETRSSCRTSVSPASTFSSAISMRRSAFSRNRAPGSRGRSTRRCSCASCIRGKDAEAEAVLAEAEERFPDNAWPKTARAHLAAARGDYARAHALALRIDAPSEVPFALRTAALFDAVQGRFTEAV